jgi:hypothetical protein
MADSREVHPEDSVRMTLIYSGPASTKAHPALSRLEIQSPLGTRIRVPRKVQDEVQEFIRRKQAGEFSFSIPIPQGSPTGLYTARVTLKDLKGAPLAEVYPRAFGLSAPERDLSWSPREAVSAVGEFASFRVSEKRVEPPQSLAEGQSKVARSSFGFDRGRSDPVGSGAEGAR